MALNKLVRLLNLSGTIQWAHAIEHLLAVTVPTLSSYRMVQLISVSIKKQVVIT